MTAIKRKQIETIRSHLYRRTPARRVQTMEQAEQFVNEAGFCFFWPIKGVELPNLFQAIAGRAREVPMAHDDPDMSKCWGWKDQALGQRRWYYAKLLCKRATLVSLDFLPVFYALSPNFGSDDDYLQDYEAGQLSWEAKNIFEALLKGGAMDTVRLRRESHLSADSAKTTFERALTELQVSMRILPIGVAEAGAWRYAFIYDLLTRHFPPVVEQARTITRSEARAKLLAQFLDNNVAASRKEIERTFSVLKWTPFELERTLDELLNAHLAMKTQVEGLKGELFVSLRALELARRVRGG